MRIRYKPYAREELAACPFFVDEPAKLAGQWGAAFKNPNLPLRMELGCGKGAFLAQTALLQPQFNYIGVDIKSEVLVVAKRKAESMFQKENAEIGNLLLTSQDIERICQIFSEKDTVTRLYINFCNPWYKAGHAKHRLSHPRQLALYRNFLAQDGEIWFKTDDEPLFKDSLAYFETAGFKVLWQSQNLHQKEPSWNVHTEHEDMFSSQGIPIKAIIAQKMPANLNLQQLKPAKEKTEIE